MTIRQRFYVSIYLKQHNMLKLMYFCSVRTKNTIFEFFIFKTYVKFLSSMCVIWSCPLIHSYLTNLLILADHFCCYALTHMYKYLGFIFLMIYRNFTPGFTLPTTTVFVILSFHGIGIMRHYPTLEASQ